MSFPNTCWGQASAMEEARRPHRLQGLRPGGGDGWTWWVICTAAAEGQVPIWTPACPPVVSLETSALVQ